VGDVPFYVKIYCPTLLQNADFQSTFAPSASAVTPSNKELGYRRDTVLQGGLVKPIQIIFSRLNLEQTDTWQF